jgi:hypothetical protein
MKCHSKSKNILPAASAAAIDAVLFSGDGRRRRRRRNDFAFGLCLL